MRAFLFAAALLLVAAGAGGYWYLTSKVEAKPVPAAVLAAEQALGLPETVGLFHFDLAHAVEVEETFLGEADREALLAPVAGSGTVVDLLLQGGLDPRQAVSHMVGALVIGETGPRPVGVLLGHFRVERLSELLAEHYEIEEGRVAGRPVLLLSHFNTDSCEVTGPYALHLTPERLVLGDPALVGTVLKRLDEGAASAIDLTAWRAYRDGKILSLALLRSPQELAEQTPHPMAQMAAGAAEAALEPIDQIYAGVAFQALPPRLVFGTRVVTDEPAWAAETAASYAAWIEDVDAELGEQLPALARLTNHLSVTAEGGQVVAEAALGEDFLDDAAEVPGEVIRLMFRGLGGSSVTVAGESPAIEEQILPSDEVTTYRASIDHASLPGFDPELDHSFEPVALTGPFGLQVDAFRLVEAEAEELVEISIEALSGEIPNMTVESLHEVSGETRAQLVITAVNNVTGIDLLREERCGSERNGLPGDLQSSSRSRYVNNTFVQVPVVQGKKAVRLAPGAGVKDIAAITGYIDLRLPTRIETRRVEAPFEGQLVELPGLRIKLTESEPGAVKYEISGSSDRVLAVRGLNAAGQYLRSAGSYASNRMLGAGKTVSKSFAGTLAAVEFVIAAEEAVQRYPFEIAPVAPAFDQWDHPKPFTVAPTSIEAFLQESANVDLSAVCEGRPEDSQVAPFQVCPQSFAAQWGGLTGKFQVLSPQLPTLLGNLSALELRLDTVDAGDGETARVPVNLGRFLRLRETYGSDLLEDTPWLQAETPEALENKKIRAVQGRLVARLPLDLDHLSLPVTELGSRASHANGLTVRLVGFWNGSLQLDVSGPRERIVQFVPRDAAGQALAVNNARLDTTDEAGQWRASLSVSGRPTTLDIVFAAAQETLEYPFDKTLNGH